MSKVLLEDVYKTSGIPTHTFVEPPEYTKLIVALRARGRGVIIEGPSGIGKTTCVIKAIEKSNNDKDILILSSRKIDDVEYIRELPNLGGNLGVVIIDDFHKLSDEIKQSLSDYMKVLADEDIEDTKIVLIGINKAGDTLVNFSEDLNNRVDTIRFELNPSNKILELIEKGEKALNINLLAKSNIHKESKGSFHITQMLCKEACIIEGIIEEQDRKHTLEVSIDQIKGKVIPELSRAFFIPAKNFSTGTKLRRDGRAPYMNMLKWLSESEEWTIQMDEMIVQNQHIKGSISQVVEKKFLNNLVSGNPQIQRVIHYDANSRVLSIEDPKFLFYIRNLSWSKFATKIGFSGNRFSSPYDFALSFAGSNRNLAEQINDVLQNNEVEVFYDKNEQHSILAMNVEDYLAPIYQSEAEYIVVLLSSEYPTRLWTKFESEQFKDRFGENSVIPIWYSNTDKSMFDKSRDFGGIEFDVEDNIDNQVQKICRLLLMKLRERRLSEPDMDE